MPQAISSGFRKLLGEPAFCQFATLMPDGSPQITQVWVETDGEHVLINTVEGSQKEKNVHRDQDLTGEDQRAGPGRVAHPAGRGITSLLVKPVA